MDDINLLDVVKNMLHSMLDLFPNLIGALGILLVGWIIARLVKGLLQKVLKKIGMDKLSDYINNMNLFGDKSSMKISLVKIIVLFIYYFTMVMVWVVAAEVLGIQAITELLQSIIDYMPNLLVAFIYLLLGVMLADLARKFVKSALDSVGVPSSGLIAGFVFYFLVINILLGALTQAKVNTEFIAANISIILGGIVLAFAIGYGLASRFVAGNLISSFYWKDKFSPGDHVSIEETSGIIQNIDKAHLVIKTDEGDTAIVPMNKVAGNVVTLKKGG